MPPRRRFTGQLVDKDQIQVRVVGHLGRTDSAHANDGQIELWRDWIPITHLRNRESERLPQLRFG